MNSFISTSTRVSMASLVLLLISCGGGGNDTTTNTSQSDANTVSAIAANDQLLIPGTGQAVARLIDAPVEGVSYESVSGAGATFTGKTNQQGDFITYPGGTTRLTIGSVDIGNWTQPIESSASGGRQTLVQLPDLSYGIGGCSVQSKTDAARIILSLNTSPNTFYLRMPSSATLSGCPNDANFFSINRVATTSAVADAHIASTLTSVDALKKISSTLFAIPLSDIDDKKSSLGVDYSYNGYGAPWAEIDGQCLGYDGGHAGVDLQTFDVKGTKTANRSVYSLTSGTVVGVDLTSGRVVVEASLTVDGKAETVYIGYLHMRDIAVKKDDFVQAGITKLGVQGNLGLGYKTTDTNSAEHVHVEFNNAKPSTLARCGASPAAPKIASLNPEKYFSAIAGSLTKRWTAEMTNYGVIQMVSFESNLTSTPFTARGTETYRSGTCTLTSTLDISGTRVGNQIALRTTTTTSRQTCPDGVYSAQAGFVRNYTGAISGNSIAVNSVDQCDLTWVNPLGCFKFNQFTSQ